MVSLGFACACTLAYSFFFFVYCARGDFSSGENEKMCETKRRRRKKKTVTTGMREAISSYSRVRGESIFGYRAYVLGFIDCIIEVIENTCIYELSAYLRSD